MDNSTLQDVCTKIGISFKQVPPDGKWHQTDAEGKHLKNGNGRNKIPRRKQRGIGGAQNSSS